MLRLLPSDPRRSPQPPQTLGIAQHSRGRRKGPGLHEQLTDLQVAGERGPWLNGRDEGHSKSHSQRKNGAQSSRNGVLAKAAKAESGRRKRGERNAKTAKRAKRNGGRNGRDGHPARTTSARSSPRRPREARIFTWGANQRGIYQTWQKIASNLMN